MKPFSRQPVDLEHHQIDLAFSHLRISVSSELKKLTDSIDTNGQVVPVAVTLAEGSPRFTLIDGYLRVQALKALRRDIVRAEVWACSEPDALLFMLANHRQRNWECLEEAHVIRELRTRYQLTQEQIAEKTGRSQSWVSHRLTLIDELPEPIIDAVRRGKLGVWSAQRVLLPIARAIPEHAGHLLEYLSSHKHHTRELSEFLHHYQKSNRVTRERMVTHPDLFFKSQKTMKEEKITGRLRGGPEGEWQYRIAGITDRVRYLERLLPRLFYDRQEEMTARCLRLPLEKVRSELDRLLMMSRRQCHDRQNDAADNCYASPIGEKQTANQQPAECVTEHGEKGSLGRDGAPHPGTRTDTERTASCCESTICAGGR